MKGKISFFFFLFSYLFSFLNYCNTYALNNSPFNNSEEKITSLLVNEGFENVIAIVNTNSVIISYENRIYRSEPEACANVVKIVLSAIEKEKDLKLLPKLRGISILLIKIPAKVIEEITAFNKFDYSKIDVYIDTDLYTSALNHLTPSNSSKYKIDIIVHPQVKARFGNFDKVAETQINLAPEIRTSIWKGMSFSAQAILPLHNELDSVGNYIRPGFVTVNQFIRLPFNSFASGTLGYFSDKRYGADLEIKNYLMNGKVSFGFNLGYTGMAFYQKGTWHYSNETTLTSLASASYRHPQLDLNLKISYGTYLQKDKGVRLEINRQFGETEIGFFCSKTTLSNNGGFYFSVPLFPSKYWKIKTVRVRPVESFPWEYRYKTIDEDLRIYDTGNRIDNLLKDFNPDYFKKQLMNEIKKLKGEMRNETSQ